MGKSTFSDKLADLGKKFTNPGSPDQIDDSWHTNYLSKAYYTKKQIPKAKKRKLNKIARKSRKINHRQAKNK